MQIESTSLTQVLSGLDRAARIQKRPAAKNDSVLNGKTPDVNKKEDNIRFSLGKADIIKSGLNNIARKIRIADNALGEISNYIDQMKSQLENIVKRFPPFPPGSEERIENLKRFNAFRKLIDKLTVPPPDNEFAGTTIADSESKPWVGNPELTEDNKRSTLNILYSQIYTGLKGLELPELNGHATDDEIIGSLPKLDSAGKAITKMREDMKRDSVKIIRNKMEKSESEKTDNVIAEEKSNDLKHAFMFQRGISLTQATPSYLFASLK